MCIYKYCMITYTLSFFKPQIFNLLTHIYTTSHFDKLLVKSWLKSWTCYSIFYTKGDYHLILLINQVWNPFRSKQLDQCRINFLPTHKFISTESQWKLILTNYNLSFVYIHQWQTISSTIILSDCHFHNLISWWHWSSLFQEI